ncbi:Cyclic nucleotide-binding domain-containing protein [Marinitoga hydrogenitolerans DSM 16785]|uniref:Cyclic nucleotide-binding domain-containing protein n=1 Tax=Marinitoga hydrogenitolerans (strain DSM 16785 / JCM 12826 / AT1271) TaxID=1122195 RepID=A0A1M4XKS2_MARH1|nr:cyclic nucleotide-binding domain-containing protein [Marinitoga hydrogenitolerans]SHE94164.1 Cyclic nucleotide-binding domain-containing protein [Marinitoga hydrogenitolerans DSM 16785]
MEKLIFFEEETIQEENGEPIGLIILKKGALLCQSHFCNYRKIYINKGIFSEEFLFQMKVNEFLSNIRNSEILLLDNLKEANEFLANNSELLKFAIEKRINMLIKMNEKISLKFTKLDEVFSYTKEETKKFFKHIYRYNWNHFNDKFIQNYILAREKILEDEYEDAFEVLNKINLNEIKDNFFKAEIDIWKIYCTNFFNTKKAHNLFDKIHFKYDFLDSLFSFKILRKTLFDENLDTIYKTYLKKGYLIPSNTVLFYEKEDGDWSFLILSGNVYVSKFVDEKTEILLNILTEGEIVGEIAVLQSIKRTATVFTKTPLQMILINSENFESLIEESYLLGKNILKALINRVDFQKSLAKQNTLTEKASLLIKKYSIKRLNSLHLTPSQFINLFGIQEKIDDFFSEILLNKIATLRPDGTLYFK